MQNHLRINYCPGFWPYLILCLLFFIYAICIFLLNLEMLYQAVMLVAGFILCGYEYRQLKNAVIRILRHDGKSWITDIEGKVITLELGIDSFASRFLVSPVFVLPGEKKKQRLFFTRQNCTESDFRYLCRLIAD